jgi:hypothetical protein
MPSFMTREALGQQAKAVHAGLNTALFKMSLSVTPAALDTIEIGRLPYGAVPLKVIAYRDQADATQGAFSLGTSASFALIAASVAFATADRATALTPNPQAQRLSASASDPQRGIPLVVTALSGLSVGNQFHLAVQYVMDDARPRG